MKKLIAGAFDLLSLRLADHLLVKLSNYWSI